MLYIFPYNIVCNLFSNCSVEISLFPKVASPKLFLYFRELFKDFTARYAFDYPNHSRYRVSWGKRNQYVNMIFRYFTSIYFKIKMTCYFKEKLLHSWDFRHFFTIKKTNGRLFEILQPKKFVVALEEIKQLGFSAEIEVWGDNFDYIERSFLEIISLLELPPDIVTSNTLPFIMAEHLGLL